jgi:hypothetical protein
MDCSDFGLGVRCQKTEQLMLTFNRVLGRTWNGLLSLHGRAKEVFVISGKKISLGDIDKQIETVPAAWRNRHCPGIDGRHPKAYAKERRKQTGRF